METIRVLKRFNDGNYEHTEVEVTRPNEDNTVQAVIGLEAEIVAAYKKESTAVKTEAVKEEVNPGVKPTKEKKEEVKEEPKKEEKKTTKKKVTKRAPKKSACVAYDREQQAHKDDFASILNDKCEGWKGSKPSLKAAKEASLKLHGVLMFGPDGNVLGTFTDLVYDLVSPALDTGL